MYAAVAQFRRKQHGPDGKQQGVDGVERMGASGPFKVTDDRGRVLLGGTVTVENGWHPDATAVGGVAGRPSTTAFRVIGALHNDGDEERAKVEDEGAGAGATHGVNVSTPALLELTPQTGRKHQLRVHCAYILKCPMVRGEVFFLPETGFSLFPTVFSCIAPHALHIAVRLYTSHLPCPNSRAFFPGLLRGGGRLQTRLPGPAKQSPEVEDGLEGHREGSRRARDRDVGS